MSNAILQTLLGSYAAEYDKLKTIPTDAAYTGGCHNGGRPTFKQNKRKQRRELK